MLSPKPFGPEQILNQIYESSSDFTLARFTAGVGPAQAAPSGVKVGDSFQPGVGVVYQSAGLTGATWRIIVTDDGRLTRYDALGSIYARNASCTRHGGAFVYEDREERASPGHPPHSGRIMLRSGRSPLSWGFPLGQMHNVILDRGEFFYEEDLEKSWNFAPQTHVFAPTVCELPGGGQYLALWNVGLYELGLHGPGIPSRRSLVRGSVVPVNHQEIRWATETFDFEWTSLSSDRFNANLHAFQCAIDVETEGGQVTPNKTIGLVNSNVNGQIQIRVFDMRGLGVFHQEFIYSSEWSPAPGLDPTGISGGGHPVVAWIGRDDGDVHVVIAQPRARLSAGIGSVFAFGRLFVANQPVPKGGLGNRRPSLAALVLRGGARVFVVAWEAPPAEGVNAGMYRDIKARVFDYSGQPQTDEFTVNGPHFAGRAAPNVVPLENNRGFYVVWMENSAPPPGLGSWCIKGQPWTFDAI